MKLNLDALSNFAAVAIILSPTCQPAPHPSPCTFGTGMSYPDESTNEEFPGMIPCPKLSCACGEKATCLNKGSSCACTCVKMHQDCSYPWRTTCLTSCRSSHRCLCTCAGPIPEYAPSQPCCPDNITNTKPAATEPCCPNGQQGTAALPAQSPPCC
ncbi:uncharacterized protein [Dermacentor andersoni]|uniref:uncharacterized protein n=1 Tax=Dermacentor andersoni TaxID=34620 RepID=UPI0021550346|nr:keratin-associated protein 10-5-like [Dermacentor andersoni]